MVAAAVDTERGRLLEKVGTVASPAGAVAAVRNPTMDLPAALEEMVETVGL